MAADTRPYKSKEQDGQGNEVIIRDQQLVEQSTVTTMPSGACFETLDIDGRPVKIPRDNMMSIVLECIGIVLNDSSKNLGTNVNKALGLQGNTIGNVTVNDFASVLGANPYSKWQQVETNVSHANGEAVNYSGYGLYILSELEYNKSQLIIFINSYYDEVRIVYGTNQQGWLSKSGSGLSFTITYGADSRFSLSRLAVPV